MKKIKVEIFLTHDNIGGFEFSRKKAWPSCRVVDLELGS
jgi:hypothetical protein